MHRLSLRPLRISHLSLLSWRLLSPDAADSTTFDVQLGDIILTATDGLFDNMPDYMILQELKKLKVRAFSGCHRREINNAAR